MFANLTQHIRTRLLTLLRPGKTHQELLTVIERSEAILSDEQRRMFEAMIDFQETRVREIMVPRSDMYVIDETCSMQEAAALMVASNVLRLPVMKGDKDHMVGVIHSKALFAACIQDEPIELADLIQPHLSVPELSHIAPLLIEMREKKQHLAIVLDEFGGTTGLVTFTDLLEEIMGSIDESNHLERPEYVFHDDGSVEVSARMHVEDLEETIKTTLPKGDYDTLGGLILNELGRIPYQGEQLCVAGLDIHIQEADPRRIVRVLIKPNH
ncbi:MAG: hemolysin family protein [Mariprofundaceae bacterium]|nr:hemolysin family protein [Mariprofundaceae bacterium]